LLTLIYPPFPEPNILLTGLSQTSVLSVWSDRIDTQRLKLCFELKTADGRRGSNTRARQEAK
jgi:hypothetical protein